MGKKDKKAKEQQVEIRAFQGPLAGTDGAATSAASTDGRLTKPASVREAAEANTLSSRNWKKAEIAYNDEGNIVILDPEVASRIRLAARADRELEIGIPNDDVSYKPNPLPEGTRGGAPVLNRNELCVCDFLRFHLMVEGPVHHDVLSIRPRS